MAKVTIRIFQLRCCESDDLHQQRRVVFKRVYSMVQPSPLDTAASVGVELEYGTTEKVRTVFLQRLADPLANYDPVSNPYITVIGCPWT